MSSRPAVLVGPGSTSSPASSRAGLISSSKMRLNRPAHPCRSAWYQRHGDEGVEFLWDGPGVKVRAGDAPFILGVNERRKYPSRMCPHSVAVMGCWRHLNGLSKPLLKSLIVRRWKPKQPPPFESFLRLAPGSLPGLLVRQGWSGMVAGDAAALDLPPSAFTLIQPRGPGDGGVRGVSSHWANLSLMRDLIAYLTEETLCRPPERCLDLATWRPLAVCPAARRRPEYERSLFMYRHFCSIPRRGDLQPPGARRLAWPECRKQSPPVLSIHAPWRCLGQRRGSAGIEGYVSKSWDRLPVTPDLVVTVCGNTASGRPARSISTLVLRTHWGVDDPAQATGSDAEIDAAKSAYTILRAPASKPSWPCRSTSCGGPTRFKAELDRIGLLLA